MIQINRKRLFFFFTLIVLSASAILISPNLKQAVASERFTSYLLTQSITQAPSISPSSPQIIPSAKASPEPPPFYEQQDFWGKVAIAVISAILQL